MNSNGSSRALFVCIYNERFAGNHIEFKVLINKSRFYGNFNYRAVLFYLRQTWDVFVLSILPFAIRKMRGARTFFAMPLKIYVLGCSLRVNRNDFLVDSITSRLTLRYVQTTDTFTTYKTSTSFPPLHIST